MSATDACGNSATAAQVVTVRDTTAPVFVAASVPADVTNECNAVSAPASPSATDNCDLNPVISFNAVTNRSEERRVGEESRSRWAPDPLKKKRPACEGGRWR